MTRSKMFVEVEDEDDVVHVSLFQKINIREYKKDEKGGM